jgi:hypothetical protein
MLPERVLLYGKDEPLPARRELRAGPLSMTWEEGDLRYIRLGGREVLRRVYVAVRDRNWGTAPNAMSNLTIDAGDDTFRISFDVDNRLGEIDFGWRGEITGEADGTVRLAMDGVARTTFMKNRIGFCILHPDDLAGAKAVVEHVDGAIEESVLPQFFVPDQPVQPFAEMRRLSHEVTPGVWADLLMEGDIFEMEDQRNWTDASFKTFCTPLRLPYPVEIAAGTRIRQSLTLAMRGPLPHGARPAEAKTGAEPVTFDLDLDTSLPLPRLGLGCAWDDSPLTAGEIDRLRALRLSHLRVDLDLADPLCAERLRRASGEAACLGAELEAALFIDPAGSPVAIETLQRALDEVRPAVARWLVFPAREHFGGGSPVREALDAARPALEAYSAAPVYSGTNTDYIFLARNKPPIEKVDGITFAITAQVHAFDNASIVETLGTQGQAVASARALAQGKPVCVSPVTMKMRHNPYATGAIPPVPAGQLPSQVDPRQMSLFLAGWTAASIKHLAQAGAASITYYETVGWRGVMERESGSTLPAKFPSLPGALFPVYHVFADIAEFGAASVITSQSSARLKVDGLALKRGNNLRVLLSNLTAEPQTVTLPPRIREATLRLLSASNAEAAMREPRPFNAIPRQLSFSEGAPALVLSPYGLAALDAHL